MKTPALNEMKLSFPSSSANESFARAAVSAFAAQLDPTVDELSDIRTAVSEAVTNCIVHGFAVMESFMNRLHVTSRPGRGTTVTMEKRLSGRCAHGR